MKHMPQGLFVMRVVDGIVLFWYSLHSQIGWGLRFELGKWGNETARRLQGMRLWNKATWAFEARGDIIYFRLRKEGKICDERSS
jgi:hypothetical protein